MLPARVRSYERAARLRRHAHGDQGDTSHDPPQPLRRRHAGREENRLCVVTSDDQAVRPQEPDQAHRFARQHRAARPPAGPGGHPLGSRASSDRPVSRNRPLRPRPWHGRQRVRSQHPLRHRQLHRARQRRPRQTHPSSAKCRSSSRPASACHARMASGVSSRTFRRPSHGRTCASALRR